MPGLVVNCTAVRFQWLTIRWMPSLSSLLHIRPLRQVQPEDVLPFKLQSMEGSEQTKACHTDPLRQRWTSRIRRALQSTGVVVRQYPSIIIWPLLLFIVAAGLGIWAVCHSGVMQERHTRQRATEWVQHIGNDLSSAIFEGMQPALALAAFVRYNPSYPPLAAHFNEIAHDLLAQSPPILRNMRISPAGIIRQVYPQDDSDSALIGLDSLHDPQTQATAMATVAAGVPTAVHLIEVANHRPKLLIRFPVYISNVSATEDFGMPPGVQNCSICYNTSTSTKFWGFISISLDYLQLTDGPGNEEFVTADALQYHYRLVNEDPTESYVITASHGAPEDTTPYVKYAVVIPNSKWVLYLLPKGGFGEPWVAPTAIGTALLAFLICVLVFRSLLSYRQHEILLHSLVPSNVLDRVRQQDNAYRMRDAANGSIVDNGSPADHILHMMGQLLRGEFPSTPDIILVRTAIASSFDLYAPIALEEQIKDVAGDEDVGAALSALVGKASKHVRSSPVGPLSATTADFFQSLKRSDSTLTRMRDAFSTMRSALEVLMDPAAVVLRVDGGVSPSHRASITLGNPRSSIVRDGAVQGDQHRKISVRSQSTNHSRLSLAYAVRSSVRQQPDLEEGEGLLHPSISTFIMQPDDPEAVLGMNSTGHQTHTTLPPHERGLKAVGHGRGPDADDVSGSQAQDETVQTSIGSLPSPTLAEGAAFAADMTPAPAPPIFEEVELVLASCHGWAFDAMKLHDVSHGRPLSTLAYFLLSQSNLLATFKLPCVTLARYLRGVEDGYQNNPYHNATHAADVLQSIHVILHRGGMVGNYVDPISLMACYLAAIVHDLDHPGRTNDFLISTKNDLAMTYNDKAPLENHHAAASSKLLMETQHNFISHLSKANQDTLRKMLIELVLATDMKQHFACASHFAALHKLGNGCTPDKGPFSPVTSQSQVDPFTKKQSGLQSNRGTHSQCTVSAADNYEAVYGGSGPPKVPLDDTERLLSLQMALKLSDLGHICAPLPVHLRWVSCLEAEFFSQGDQERHLNLPISPLFDRTKPGVTKSQVGFFDIVILPCLHNFTRVFDGCQPLYQSALHNYRHWQREASIAAAASQAQHPLSHSTSSTFTLRTNSAVLKHQAMLPGNVPSKGPSGDGRDLSGGHAIRSGSRGF